MTFKTARRHHRDACRCEPKAIQDEMGEAFDRSTAA